MINDSCDCFLCTRLRYTAKAIFLTAEILERFKSLLLADVGRKYRSPAGLISQ